MDEALGSISKLIGIYFFDAASLLIASAALIYAALALRVARKAQATTEMSEVAALKMTAQEKRMRAEHSFLALQSVCQEMRSRWSVHHDRHSPIMGNQDFRRKDTIHIDQLESEGRELLRGLELDMSEVRELSADALDEYIQRADETALRIEQLALRLSPPKPLLA